MTALMGIMRGMGGMARRYLVKLFRPCTHVGQHQVIEVYPQPVGAALGFRADAGGMPVPVRINMHRVKERCCRCNQITVSIRGVIAEEAEP